MENLKGMIVSKKVILLAQRVRLKSNTTIFLFCTIDMGKIREKLAKKKFLASFLSHLNTGLSSN
jgi:hypothetical protein